MAQKELKPITPVPYDPENGRISRDEFLAKRRKKKELDARMKAYEQKARKEIEEEIDNEGKVESIKDENLEVVEEEKKRGRPRKTA